MMGVNMMMKINHREKDVSLKIKWVEIIDNNKTK